MLHELFALASGAVASSAAAGGTERAGAAPTDTAPVHLGSPSTRIRLRLGTEVVDTITVVARFGSPHEALLEERRIELVHPVDAHAESVLRRLTPAPGPFHDGAR